SDIGLLLNSKARVERQGKALLELTDPREALGPGPQEPLDVTPQADPDPAEGPPTEGDPNPDNPDGPPEAPSPAEDVHDGPDGGTKGGSAQEGPEGLPQAEAQNK